MNIILSPLASDRDTAVSVSGFVVTVDGTPHDLSVIPEGGQAEAEESGPFVGIVTRDKVVIKYHYNSATAEPSQSVDWADYTFEVASGVVPDPIERR